MSARAFSPLNLPLRLRTLSSGYLMFFRMLMFFMAALMVFMSRVMVLMMGLVFLVFRLALFMAG